MEKKRVFGRIFSREREIEIEREEEVAPVNASRPRTDDRVSAFVELLRWLIRCLSCSSVIATTTTTVQKLRGGLSCALAAFLVVHVPNLEDISLKIFLYRMRWMILPPWNGPHTRHTVFPKSIADKTLTERKKMNGRREALMLARLLTLTESSLCFRCLLWIVFFVNCPLPPHLYARPCYSLLRDQVSAASPNVPPPLHASKDELGLGWTTTPSICSSITITGRMSSK